MKKFCCRVAAYLTLIALILASCAAIDPFRVFHPFSGFYREVEPNQNYIKMTCTLAQPERFDAFLFGSSRVGSLHVEKISQYRCYNLYYSEGLPAEHLENIKTLLKNHMLVRRIYMGVDSLSYTIEPEGHQTQQLRAPYEYMQEHLSGMLKLYLNPTVVIKALPQIFSASPISADEHEKNIFYSHGWHYDYGADSGFDFTNANPIIGSSKRLEKTLEEIAEIVRICNDRGIGLTIFTNPMYDVTYQASLQMDYMEFLRRLAEITPFYNFSGYNDITLDSENYVDTSHYKAEVGDMILEVICNGKRYEGLYEQGFGVYVTPENAEAFITVLEHENQAHGNAPSG